jgi:hypothetical protein
MNTLNIAATDDTPLVNFNETDSSLKISGRSMPEDAISFYTPIIRWIEECQTTGFGLSQIDFHFEFLSTSSTKQIMKVFQTVNKINVTKEIKVNWLYDENDINMKRTGELLLKLVQFNMNFSEVGAGKL